MLRRVSTFLVVVCLLLLSGIDLVEDLRTPRARGAFWFPATQLPPCGQGQNLANDIFESARRPRTPILNPLMASAADTERDGALFAIKPRRLHKLNHVYLI